jgi:glycosyltransferase involved in cell wall biosynthesis
MLVKKDIADAKLLLIGDGPSHVLERIWKLALEYDLLNNIATVKNPTEAKKIELLKQCKVLGFPSYAEGIPLVFYEAMRLGIPVVAYFLPSYVDIKPCIIGVRIGHIEELAKALKVLIKNDELRMLMSRRAKLCASEHDWDSLFLSFINQLNSIGVT